MANLTESVTYDAGVYQLETTDILAGGASGVSNSPQKNLANRTAYLKKHVDDIESGATTLPGYEQSANKSTSIVTDQASNTKYPSVRSVYDWATGLFQTLSNKDASSGYAGLTLLKLNLKNAAGTITNFFTSATTAARTWTMPDYDGTVAMFSDIANTAQSGLTNLVHPDLSGNFRDLYRSGWLPAWFNQQWGGSQWGNLPDGSFGSTATGNIQDDYALAGQPIGFSTSYFYIGQGFKLSESIANPTIWLKIGKIGNPTDNISVSIYTTSGGLPLTNLGSIGLSGKLITSNTNGEWISFTPTVGTLSSNTLYAVVISRTGAASSTDYYGVKSTSATKYPHGNACYGNSGGTFTNSSPYSICFNIQNSAANSLIQSGGQWDYKLAFNPGTPINQSRSLAQPLANFYDGKSCTVLYRGNFAVSTNIWDFCYGIDHDRITLTINASGYPVVTVYRQDRTAYSVTGTGSVATGFHDVGIKVRTFGNGADYLYLYVDGVSVGTPLTTQTFTMDSLMPLLGTARLGDGFGLVPTWTQDMQMTSLPSAQGWTWGGTAAVEVNAMSVAGGKLYQNANGYAATDQGWYTKTTAFSNTTGWAYVTKLKVSSDNNILDAAKAACLIYVNDGTKLIQIHIHEYFLEVSNGATIDFIIQGDFKSQENVFLLQGQGSDYYLFINGRLVVDGTTKLISGTAANAVYQGDSSNNSGANADVTISYIKYYQGGMLLPIANNSTCSEFTHWSGDKSSLLPYAWNSGTPVSIKQLCGVNKNYIGEGVVQTYIRNGIVSSPTTSSPTDTVIPDMEIYALGSSIDSSFNDMQQNSVLSSGMFNRVYIDGAQSKNLGYISAPGANYSTNISLLDTKITSLGLHKCDVRWAVGANTTTSNATCRIAEIEAKS